MDINVTLTEMERNVLITLIDSHLDFIEIVLGGSIISEDLKTLKKKLNA